MQNGRFNMVVGVRLPEKTVRQLDSMVDLNINRTRSKVVRELIFEGLNARGFEK